MIFEALLNMVLSVLQTAFSVLPDLPDMPEAITGAMTAFYGMLELPIEYVQWWLSEPLFVAVITVLIAIWQFENVYHFTMFLIKKIPFINVK